MEPQAQHVPQKAQKTTAITAAEANAIAQEAYIFGLPLVYVAVSFDAETNVAKPAGIRAPINQFAHVREFPDAKANPIVGMNVDTLYSIGHLDLAVEPIVLSVGEMGDRWWIMQLIDAWNDVPASPGSRTLADKGGNFALVGPHWKGKLPPGLSEIRSDTDLLMIGGRTYTAGKADFAAVHKAQDGYRLTPLSKWGTQYTPPSSVPVKPGIDVKTPPPKQVFAMSAQEFFSRLNALMVGNPPRQNDSLTLALIAKIGVAPGVSFDLEEFEPDVRKAIEDAIPVAQQAIRDEEAHMGEMVNGWQIARDLGRYGTKYLYRAAWTFFAVGGNLVEDACYPLALADSEGKKLTGTNTYVIHFAKDQIPPVNAFWSLTMYDLESYLVPNTIDRYALGDRDKLKFGNDGSLTVYLQQKSPGVDKESNWLPTPAGGFKLALRLYVPKKSVADGTWKPPAVERMH